MKDERGLGRRRRRQEIGVFPANDELLDAVVADADDFLPLDLLRVGDWVVDDEGLSVVVVVDVDAVVAVAVAAAELVFGVGNPRAVIDVCDAKNVKLFLFLF